MVNVMRRRTAASPRYLVQRHAQRLLSVDTLADAPDKLFPGEEQLYSFYLPSLYGGDYNISTSQTVTIPNSGDSLSLKGKQPFTVEAPQYSLPDGSIHSVYPPQGHGDAVETLPHIVFTDPQLPWERRASAKLPEDGDPNRVPWLAVLVFEQEELVVSDPSVWDQTSLSKPVQQSTTLAVNMSLADLAKVQHCRTPVKSKDEKTKADFVFLQKGLFNELVKDYGLLKQNKAQTHCSLSRYQWLAHVRNINTTGMADSGIGEELGVFSIIVSHRVGPLGLTQPTSVVVHLVSLEGIEELPYPVTEDRVGLCSLHSWSYTCLPANSLNIPDAFRHLGDTLDVLRPQENIIKGLKGKSNQQPEAARIAQRLEDGYTLTRYRTRTGEATAALLRGPFAPTKVTHELKTLSHFGTDLQVMDKELGIMDISYSVAWQLGKTLALADQSFTTALGRVRSMIFSEGVGKAKVEVLRQVGGYKSRAETLKALADSLGDLNDLSHTRLARGPVARWMWQDKDSLDLAFDSDLIEPRFHEHAKPVAQSLASAQEGGLYNELNTQTSTDWMIVFTWVLDRLFLDGIPAHYLIPDPSHLPPESLRFFRIDTNWMNALIDGALSVANLIDKDDDKVRTRIKDEINEYLGIHLATLSYHPQIPTHGFLLRSELCTKYPDLIVEATGSVPRAASDGAPILRQVNIDESVMLVLFDRAPGGDTLNKLVFRQPPHQQSFTVGEKLDNSHLNISYKRIYTIRDPPTDETRRQAIYSKTFKRNDSPAVFVWGSGDGDEIRTLKLPDYAEDIYQTIYEHMPVRNGRRDYDDTKATAALVGIQLNNPMYYLEILLKAREKEKMSLLGGCGPRLLSMLEPKLKRDGMRAAAMLTRSLDPGPGDFSAMLPAPGHRVRLTRHSALSPPPDARALPTMPARIPDPDPPMTALGDEAKPPEFKFKVYSLGSKETVIMHPKLPQDLIFSITLKPGSGDDYRLREIEITVRMGSTKALRKNLMLEYKGTGANMLSNLRFNVIPMNGTDNTLVLRLLPRSTSGWVDVLGTREMSFVLNGVIVNNYEESVEVQTAVLQKYDNGQKIKEDFDIKLVTPA